MTGRPLDVEHTQRLLRAWNEIATTDGPPVMVDRRALAVLVDVSGDLLARLGEHHAGIWKHCPTCGEIHNAHEWKHE